MDTVYKQPMRIVELQLKVIFANTQMPEQARSIQYTAKLYHFTSGQLQRAKSDKDFQSARNCSVMGHQIITILARINPNYIFPQIPTTYFPQRYLIICVSWVWFTDSSNGGSVAPFYQLPHHKVYKVSVLEREEELSVTQPLVTWCNW